VSTRYRQKGVGFGRHSSAIAADLRAGQPRPFADRKFRRASNLPGSEDIFGDQKERAIKTVRLVVVMSACIAVAVAAGYRLAVVKEHNRLERNKTLARLSHDKVWSERNNDAAVKVAREIYTNDFIAHTWAGDSTGLEAFVKDLIENRSYFPDWKETVQSVVAEGDLVAVRFLSTGTQGQDLPAVPHILPFTPNRHRPLRMPEIEIFRVANGKLAEQWDVLDNWNANAQLGLFDPDHWPESVCGTGQKR
jgi:predicted ester cyclase